MADEFTPISDDLPIELSARALEMGKLKVAEAEGGPIGIRVGIKGGGCSGLQYHFEFAEAVREKKDIVAEIDGFTLLVDRRSLKYLSGSILDWNDALVGYGFRWKNPNAKKDCGCGSSFQA